MKVSAIDACHSCHSIYRDGRMHSLTSLCGDDHLIVMAWMWAETESGPTYKYFADHCKAAGLARYLNKANVIFSPKTGPTPIGFPVWDPLAEVLVDSDNEQTQRNRE